MVGVVWFADWREELGIVLGVRHREIQPFVNLAGFFCCSIGAAVSGSVVSSGFVSIFDSDGNTGCVPQFPTREESDEVYDWLTGYMIGCAAVMIAWQDI
ncbi:hypothetical protein MKZ26_18450 [Sporosarcina sp. FSL K6-6792]|uniref:hypothetical protein n=1 Tax=Sporosarcina sp. FSL K6-6792 TaxID=2921559 RepID=UPI0030FB39D0